MVQDAIDTTLLDGPGELGYLQHGTPRVQVIQVPRIRSPIIRLQPSLYTKYLPHYILVYAIRIVIRVLLVLMAIV